MSVQPNAIYFAALQIKPLRVLKLLRIFKTLQLLGSVHPLRPSWFLSPCLNYEPGKGMPRTFVCRGKNDRGAGDSAEFSQDSSCLFFTRRLEDEMSYWLGRVPVKFMTLFINLAVSIHLFCCAYWRVKVCTCRGAADLRFSAEADATGVSKLSFR